MLRLVTCKYFLYTIFEILLNKEKNEVKPQDVKNYYGSLYNFRKMTGMATGTLANWLKWGFVPENAQYKVERLTKGKLKTEWTDNEQK